MRRAALLAAALGLAGTGCRHARQQAPAPPRAGTVETAPGKPPVASSPQSLFGRDGVLAVQRALAERGLRVLATGVLDDQTQAALTTFQRGQGLAETGMPTVETLRRLGVDGDAIYRGRELDHGG